MSKLSVALINSDITKLLHCLTHDNLMPLERAEAVAHAFVDIAESIHEVYSVLLPKLVGSSELSIDERKELLWDIREEFRHIEYHMNDAKLADL